MPRNVTKKKKPPVKRGRRKSKSRVKKSPNIVIGLFLVLIFLIVAMSIINHRKKIAVDEVVEIVDEDRIETAILHAIKQLGVPGDIHTIDRRKDGTYVFVPLDKERVDLTFANMILTGQIELAGGEIVKGEELSRGAVQVLTVKDDQRELPYIIRLYYDTRGRYPEKLPRLAIIVDDFGEFAGSLLDDFLATDPNVTFAILPDLRHSKTVMERAAEMGRETILHIPMEPLNYPRNNPGPNAVMVEHSEREISRIMEGYLRQLPHVAGANNHMGSLATTDERVMNAVLNVIEKHNLYFVDSRTTSLSVAYETAQKMLIPSVQRDLFLDAPDSSEKTMRATLVKLKEFKAANRDVVVITHCFDRQRLEIMNKFIDEAKKIGYELVPVSGLFVSDVPDIL